MTAGELALVVAVVLCAIGFAAIVVLLLRVHDTLRLVRHEVAALRAETGPLLDELRQSADDARTAMDTARADLDRFDRVLGSAEAIGTAVAGSGRITRAALSAPGDQGRRARHRHVTRGQAPPTGRVMRRLVWFAGGVVAGAAGTGYAKRKVTTTVRRTAEQLAPSNVARGAATSVRRSGSRVADRRARGSGRVASAPARAAGPARRAADPPRGPPPPGRRVAGRRGAGRDRPGDPPPASRVALDDRRRTEGPGSVVKTRLEHRGRASASAGRIEPRRRPAPGVGARSGP